MSASVIRRMRGHFAQMPRFFDMNTEKNNNKQPLNFAVARSPIGQMLLIAEQQDDASCGEQYQSS